LSTTAKILVTGGAGFIGSHTVVELISKGYEVIIADDFSNSHQEVIDSIQQITGVRPHVCSYDLRDHDAVSAIFRQHRPDAVIHFAAKKLVGESVEKPLHYYRSNLLSLLNVVESALETDCRRIVFSSSCTVYGQPEVLPVSEKSPLKKAESPYGNTKKIAEDILEDTAHVTALKAVSLRYFNPVGAHESALIGEYPLGAPSNLMPVMTQTAIGKRKSFSIFGTDYNTNDGTCIRDYIHVTDLALAHVAAIDRLFSTEGQGSYEVFNIGTGKGISVKEMVDAFEKVNNLKMKYDITARRPGDVEQVWADTQKANSVLGWKANRSLEEMVASAWKWEQHLAQKSTHSKTL
jgi:UDP-glucose 4-epimerase